jgi:hypothetical protein
MIPYYIPAGVSRAELVVRDVGGRELNTHDLGSSSLRWRKVYGVNGDFSTLTVSGLMAGSVIFAGADGSLSQDNANFFWDDANNWLGIGTNTPATTLHVAGSTTLGNNAAVDRVTLNARVQSHVVPSADNAYDLGENTTPLRWRSGYFGTQVKVGTSVSLVAGTPDRLEYSGDGIVRTGGYLAVETGGAERLRVRATGEVVVQNQDPHGTPTTTVLQVLGGNGGTGATQVIIQAGVNQSGVNLLEWVDDLGNTQGVIDANGLVGIGTATPGQKLHVEGNGSVSAVFVNGGVDVGTVNPLATLHVVGENPGVAAARFEANVGSTPLELQGVPPAAPTDEVLRIDPATGEVKRSTAAAVISAGIIKGSFSIATSGSSFTISVAPADIQPGAIVTVTLVGPSGGTIYPLMVTNVNAVAETITVESSATIPGGAGDAIHYIIINP